MRRLSPAFKSEGRRHKLQKDYYEGLAPFLFNMEVNDERVASFSRYVE